MNKRLLLITALLFSFFAWNPDVGDAAVRHHRRRYRHGYVVRRRSHKKEAAIIGGSAAAGGAGGTVYDLKSNVSSGKAGGFRNSEPLKAAGRGTLTRPRRVEPPH